jgi:hypothetical protein
MIELRIEYLSSFSVVPPCEAFASLFLYSVFDYRQKTRSNTLSSVAVVDLMNNPGYIITLCAAWVYGVGRQRGGSACREGLELKSCFYYKQKL